MEIAVLYISDNNPAGHEQTPAQHVKEDFDFSTKTVVWPARLNPSWLQTVDVPTVAAGVTWEDPVYSGAWYTTGKSYKYLKGELNGGPYYWIPYGGVLPEFPISNGWIP